MSSFMAISPTYLLPFNAVTKWVFTLGRQGCACPLRGEPTPSNSRGGTADLCCPLFHFLFSWNYRSYLAFNPLHLCCSLSSMPLCHHMYGSIIFSHPLFSSHCVFLFTCLSSSRHPLSSTECQRKCRLC